MENFGQVRGNKKVGGSIHGRDYLSQFELCVIWLYLSPYESLTALRVGSIKVHRFVTDYVLLQ